MGSRSTQIIGLNERARRLIAAHIERPSTDTYSGMFGEPYPLYDYVAPADQLAKLVDERSALLEQLDGLEGRIAAAAANRPLAYREYQQEVLWSSGPCIFLALRDADGNPVEESLWQPAEIEASV
jgi:hypothetical protein